MSRSVAFWLLQQPPKPNQIGGRPNRQTGKRERCETFRPVCVLSLRHAPSRSRRGRCGRSRATCAHLTNGLVKGDGGGGDSRLGPVAALCVRRRRRVCPAATGAITSTAPRPDIGADAIWICRWLRTSGADLRKWRRRPNGSGKFRRRRALVARWWWRGAAQDVAR